MSDTPKTDAAVEWATCRPGPISSIAEFARSLERENAALRQDKERLDWLGAQVHSSNAISYSWFLAYNKPDIYAAIDAARAEEGGAT